MSDDPHMVNVSIPSLQGALHSLRVAFHRRLAKKKDLIINEADIHSLAQSDDDYSFHMRLRRISRLRRILYFVGVNKDD